jgi:hypothetical protein
LQLDLNLYPDIATNGNKQQFSRRRKEEENQPEAALQSGIGRTSKGAHARLTSPSALGRTRAWSSQAPGHMHEREDGAGSSVEEAGRGAAGRTGGV